jgi:hypothetical protein
MRFQKRDGEIINSIYYLGDGVLAQRHVKEIHFPNVSLRGMQKRISKLYQQGYIGRATNYHRHTKPIPEQVYWLGWKGAVWLGEQNNLEGKYPENPGENQLRKLQSRLKRLGIRWLREPRWSKLQHDLAVVDFHLALKKSVAELPTISIDYWLRESEFQSNEDRVDFKYQLNDGRVVQERRGVFPDSFFMILDEGRRIKGSPLRLHILLEMDMGTHPVRTRFGRQKAAPYAAYIKSPSYRARFGVNAGAWLVVTTGERRMANLIKQTKEIVGADARYFSFSIFDELRDVNLITAPVWWKVDRSEPRSLLSI